MVAVLLVAAGIAGLVSLAGASSQAQATDEGAVVLGLAGLVAAVALVTSPAAVPARSRLGVAWGGFMAWSLGCALLSGRVWASLMGEVTNLLGWFALAALTLIALAVSHRAGAVRRTLSVAAPFVVFGQTAATLVQLATGTTPRGSLPNSTYLGEALLLLLPFVLDEEDAWPALTYSQRTALAVSAVVALAAAGSRVAALAGVAWLIWALVLRRELPRARRVAVTAGLVAFVVAGGLLFARAEVMGSLGTSTLGERPQMWRAAALAVAERPLIGYGPDGFVAGGVAVTTPELARAEPVLVFRPGAVDPHNLLAWVAVSTGVPGLVLFLWWIAELGLSWRAAARERGALPRSAAPAWALSATAAVLLTAPATLQVLPLLGVVAGLSLPRAHRDTAPAGQRPLVTAVAAYAVPVIFGIGALAFSLNAATRLPLEIHDEQRSPRLAPAAQRAMDVWRCDPHLAHLASLHWGWAARVDREVAVRRLDLVAIGRAVALDARDPFVALERARTLSFYGAPDAAIESAYRATFERWELYPAARAEYAAFLAQRGRDAEAREQVAIAELVDDQDGERIRALETARKALGE